MALNPNTMQVDGDGGGLDQATLLKIITEQQVAAGIKSTDPEARIGTETAAEANARITAGYKDQPKPELTQEGAAAGAQIKFVRSGAGGVGTFKEVFPIGTPIPTERATTSGNTYDAQGNLISGTGLKTATVAATNGAITYGVSEASQSPIATIREGGSAAGKDSTGKDIYYKTEGGTGLSFYYADGSKVPVDNLIGVKQTIDFANAGWSIQGLEKGKTPAEIKYADLIKSEMNKGTKPGGNVYVRGDVVVVNDGNGVSLYNLNGSLISGKGSIYQVGIGGIDGKKINIAEVGVFGSPNYNLNASFKDSSGNPLTTVNTNSTIGDPNKPPKTLISTQVDSKTGNTIGYFADGSQEILNKGTGPVQSQEFKDAYALLEATFRDYGLESLVPTIKGYMERDLGPEQATVELRTAPEYIARFKGNQLRLAAGKNALREDIYLATERAYDETLTSYGQANYFGIDRQAKQLKMAQIIGNDISADEFKTRVDLAVTRVTNADPTIKKLLKDFYPSINDADLVGYFLNPAEGLPKLTEKVTSAEIGSAFLGQGLAYTQQRSAELAQYGIDRAGALKGAKEVKEVLPDTQKLGDVYGESGIKYTQQTAEEEFLKDNQDAATKRKRLASMERGSFSGSAGNAPGAYSTGYLKKSSTAGLI